MRVWSCPAYCIELHVGRLKEIEMTKYAPYEDAKDNYDDPVDYYDDLIAEHSEPEEKSDED